MMIEDGFNIELTEQCSVVASGCISYKEFTSGIAQYKIVKSNIVLAEGSADICALTQEASFLSSLGAPESCPVPEGRICFTDDTFIDVSQYKNMMSLIKGKTIAEIHIDHDSGSTCYKIVLEIYKK